jgi:hypothetical protein
VAEGNAHADDGIRVVSADHVDDDVALFRAQPCTLGGSGTMGEVRDRWARDEDRVDGGEDAAFAE